MRLSKLLLLCLLTMAIKACQSQEKKQSATQSVVQQAENEWTMLFDGNDASQWRNFKSQDLNWSVENGNLTTSGGKGDIITKEKYENFILEFEWKIERAGNSGVMYNVVEAEKYNSPYETGPEYQLIDAVNFKEVHGHELEDAQVTAANYALHIPKSTNVKLAGEYNLSKIVVNQGKVEHWINEEKAVEYELWSDQWKEEVANTKFKAMPDYGKAKSGHIALQDHGDAVWFREIKIKEL
ncbi:DUF1080 domain-containing protein [Porifericola rhodea]|uniref:3-keto-disaccharide hydrolase n=1 Tax=Porifericola rhodea TaxID=930972 RepID=UPI002665EEA9|nr:DUF1080 domain-containing protein [Porifericola rhodea]WKN30986.1 DUF1080 domain-containing protein [Porifericola rhodea]